MMRDLLTFPWPQFIEYVCPVEGCDTGHVPQDCHDVSKHSHVGDVPCTRPWTALCQTVHGDICYTSDHETFTDALSALIDHMEARQHVDPGAGDSDVLTPCRTLVAA